MEEEFDELKIRRRKLIEASKTPRSPEEIKEILKPYKRKNLDILIDDRECTLTYTFEGFVSDPGNNKRLVRKELQLTTSGNLRRPIEDFDFDARMLFASANSIQEAQKGVIIRRS